MLNEPSFHRIPESYFHQPEDNGNTYWCPECLLQHNAWNRARLQWDDRAKRFGVYCSHCRKLHLETREEGPSSNDH